jgi:hypothetical protein
MKEEEREIRESAEDWEEMRNDLVALNLARFLKIIVCEIKKLLHNKRNGLEIEETTHRVRENIC